MPPISLESSEATPSPRIAGTGRIGSAVATAGSPARPRGGSVPLSIWAWFCRALVLAMASVMILGIGCLNVTPAGVILADAWFEVLRVQPVIAAAPAVSGTDTGRLAEVARISQILKLRTEDLAPGIPVRLRGVVLYANAEWTNGYLHDGSGSIYFELKQPEVRAGDLIELTGEASPGHYAPIILNTQARVLGRADYPAPARVDLADLGDGHLDAQWIEMDGIVRGVRVEEGRLHLRLMSPKGQINAFIPGLGNQPAPDHLLDALVRIQGVCRSILNVRGQLVNIELQVPTLDQIQVLEPAPVDPSSLMATPISAVATFKPDRLAGRRIKIGGVVTLATEQGYFVQDESGGIRVRPIEPRALQAGDQVEVFGFPVLGGFSPELEESSFQRTGRGPLPAAQATTAEEILLQATHDGREVTLEARLVQDMPHSASPQLVLRDGAIIFTARVESMHSRERLPPWPSGSLVRLTGVCSIQGGEQNEPQSFRLRLRSSAGAQLISRPPWWTTRQTLWVLSGLGVVLLAACAWGLALRSQVRKQTWKLRAEIAERERMQTRIDKTHKELLTVSRQAGMAEIATNVLHNVGNVLNSVNISTGLVLENVKRSRASSLSRVVALLREHSHDLGEFITHDGKGKQLPMYLAYLSEHLLADQAAMVGELDSLRRNVEHIKDIVAMQQNYAIVGGVKEIIDLANLVEDSLRMNEGALSRHCVEIVREFEPVPPVNVEKHKILQILVNLVRNAKYACDESDRLDKRLTVRVANGAGRVTISVMDNGVGIPRENLTRIFNHGFTTRKDGHGFGLHSGALAAKEMDGSLTGHSDGPGLGALFTLDLPCPPAGELP